MIKFDGYSGFDIDLTGWSDAQRMHSARNSFMAAKQVFNREPTNSL
jgi:hypothetical protein